MPPKGWPAGWALQALPDHQQGDFLLELVASCVLGEAEAGTEIRTWKSREESSKDGRGPGWRVGLLSPGAGR